MAPIDIKNQTHLLLYRSKHMGKSRHANNIGLSAAASCMQPVDLATDALPRVRCLSSAEPLWCWSNMTLGDRPQTVGMNSQLSDGAIATSRVGAYEKYELVCGVTPQALSYMLTCCCRVRRLCLEMPQPQPRGAAGCGCRACCARRVRGGCSSRVL